MNKLIEKIRQTEHGFKHIIETGNLILGDKTQNHFDLANAFLVDDSYQIRMLAVYLFGQLSTNNPQALKTLETKVGNDENWRVQEMLAKAFDYYCSKTGYEKSLPTIKKWLSNENPNIKRAVIEGLRIWTSRPYFRENPKIAISLISGQRNNDSEYLRKSIGNSLRDIRKKHKQLVDEEISNWKINPKIEFIKKLIEK